jgi:hypothetical protein
MNTSIRSAALTLLFVTASVGLVGQPPQRATARQTTSTKTAATAASRSIREIVSELRRFHDESHDGVNGPLSPAVVRNLTALKHGLRDVIVETVAAQNTANVDPNALTAQMIDYLEREDVPVGDSGGYGVISRIEFRRPTEYPSWLVATTTVSIPYGEDTSLYLFELKGDSWRYALSLESNGYKGIYEAQGWLTYHVAPTTPGREPYLVTAEVSPSSASVWQALRLKVWRVGADPDHPRVLAKRSLSYCLDDAYYFSIRADGFGLIYLSESVDPELAGFRGVHYLEYVVSPRRAWVARELTIDPYNVIRKWAAQSWTLAQQSVDTSSKKGVLREWHRRMQNGHWACGPGYESVNHRLVEDKEQLLAVARCTEGQDEKPSAFAVLTASRSGFRIASISATKPSLPEMDYDGYFFAGIAGLTDPVPVSIVQPKWPANVPKTASQMKLRMSAVVDEHGEVTDDVSVLDWPDDQSGIVIPAIQALKKWKYAPGRRLCLSTNATIGQRRCRHPVLQRYR